MGHLLQEVFNDFNFHSRIIDFGDMCDGFTETKHHAIEEGPLAGTKAAADGRQGHLTRKAMLRNPRVCLQSGC